MNFNTIFTSIDNSSKSLFRYVTDRNIASLKYCLSTKSPQEINNIKDDYSNNLLHIATTIEDYPIIKYLIEMGIDKNKKNMHNVSPWDIAVRTHNQQIIQVLIDNHLSAYEEVKKELQLVQNTVDQYKNTIEEYKIMNKQMQLANGIITNKYNDVYKNYNGVSAEVHILKHQNKRLREEYNKCDTENVTLKENNKKLKIAVDSLIQSKKK